MSASAKRDASALLRDTCYYGFGKVIPGVMGLLSVVVYIRFMGASEFGRYATMFITVNVCTAFTGGWFNQAIVRYLFGWQLETNTIQEILAAFICCGSVVSIIILLGYFEFVRLASLMEIGLLCLSTIAALFQGALINIAQAKMMPIQVIQSELIKSICIIGISVFLFFIWKVEAASLLVGTIVGTLISVYPLRKHLLMKTKLDGKPWAHYFLALWNYGWPLSVWIAAQLAFQWVDRVTILREFGLDTTGLFVAWSELISRGISLPTFALATAVFPLMAAAASQGRRGDARILLRKAMLLMGILSLFLLIIAWLLGDNLYLLIFKKSDMHVSSLTLLFASGAILWQFAILIHKPIEIEGRTKPMAIIMVICLILKFILNLTTLPQFGLKAASISTVLTAGLYCVLIWLYTKLKVLRFVKTNVIPSVAKLLN